MKINKSNVSADSLSDVHLYQIMRENQKYVKYLFIGSLILLIIGLFGPLFSLDPYFLGSWDIFDVLKVDNDIGNRFLLYQIGSILGIIFILYLYGQNKTEPDYMLIRIISSVCLVLIFLSVFTIYQYIDILNNDENTLNKYTIFIFSTAQDSVIPSFAYYTTISGGIMILVALYFDWKFKIKIN